MGLNSNVRNEFIRYLAITIGHMADERMNELAQNPNCEASFRAQSGRLEVRSGAAESRAVEVEAGEPRRNAPRELRPGE